MGNIVERKNGKFQAQIRVAGIKPMTRTCADYDAAVRFIQDNEPKLKAQKTKAKKATVSTRVRVAGLSEMLGQTLAEVIDNLKEAKKTTARQERNTPTILKFVKDVRIGQIDEFWARDYIDRVRSSKTNTKRQFSYATIGNHFRIIKRLCTLRAQELRIDCPTLPLSTKLFPQGWEKKRNRRLHPKESTALKARLAVVPGVRGDQFRSLVDLAIETGARLQELVLSNWGELDLDAQVWIIPKEHTKCKVERQVPLTPYAASLFESLLAGMSREDMRVFNALKTPASVSASFHKYVKQAGIRDFRFHDLRHEACARMVRDKVIPESSIMDIVGHSDIEMLRLYANLTVWELVQMLNAKAKGVEPDFGAPARYQSDAAPTLPKPQPKLTVAAKTEECSELPARELADAANGG